jgi:hypothetical protein
MSVVALSAVAATLLLGPSAGAALSGSSRIDAAPAPTWATYFYPARVGWTCHDSFTSAGASGEETLSVAAVTSSPQGKHINVDVSGSSQSGGQDVPVNSSLQYTLTPKGGLITEASSALVVGVGAHSNGESVLPTVKALLAGGSSQSSIRESIPLPASQLAQISPILKANQTGLDVTVSLRESGKAVPTLTVPMGTLHHLLEVQTTIRTFRVTNAIPSAASEIEAAVRPTLAKVLSFTTWYAPNVGPVRVDVGGITTTATSCSG